MLGAALGAGASLLTGGIQAIAGAIQRKQAEKKMPGMEDPEQRAELERIKQDMTSMQSGTDATTAANLREINQGTAQTQQAIARNTGGNVGGTISGILQAQRTGAGQANQVYGQARQNSNYFQSLRDQMQNRISQRKLELGMYKNQQDMARSATNEQAGFQNAAQGGAALLGVIGKKQNMSQGANDYITAQANYTGEEVDKENVPAFQSIMSLMNMQNKPM